MKSAGFLLENPIFTTRAFAQQTGAPIETASRQLKRMEAEGALKRVTRGVWAQPKHPHFTPYGVVPHLLGNEQGYVSFLSALHRHGVVSQIPNVIQVATTGHPRMLMSPLGAYEFFQLHPRMFSAGIERSESRLPYLVASPEKALLDALYLSSRKSKRFERYPELELEGVDEAELRSMIATQIALEPVRKHVLTKWESLKERTS